MTGVQTCALPIYQLKNNDLKYRYIKLNSGINYENLNRLEKLFEFPKDKKRIEEIQKQVEEYEREVQKIAEKIQSGQIKGIMEK